MALRISVCVRRYSVGGKEMIRISGVLFLLWLLDPLDTLFLWRVAANAGCVLSLYDFEWEQATRSALRDLQTRMCLRDPKCLMNLGVKLCSALLPWQASISLGRPEQAWVMCLNAQLFPHLCLIKSQHDTCRKPLKHWALTWMCPYTKRCSRESHLQNGWEIELNTLSFLVPFVLMLNSHLLH